MIIIAGNFFKIKFWRTIQKKEIDFVVGGKFAYEVKVNLKIFKPGNYKTFSASYPQSKFFIVSFDSQNETIAKIP